MSNLHFAGAAVFAQRPENEKLEKTLERRLSEYSKVLSGVLRQEPKTPRVRLTQSGRMQINNSSGGIEINIPMEEGKFMIESNDLASLSKPVHYMYVADLKSMGVKMDGTAPNPSELLRANVNVSIYDAAQFAFISHIANWEVDKSTDKLRNVFALAEFLLETDFLGVSVLSKEVYNGLLMLDNFHGLSKDKILELYIGSRLLAHLNAQKNHQEKSATQNLAVQNPDGEMVAQNVFTEPRLYLAFSSRFPVVLSITALLAGFPDDESVIRLLYQDKSHISENLIALVRDAKKNGKMAYVDTEIRYLIEEEKREAS